MNKTNTNPPSPFLRSKLILSLIDCDDRSYIWILMLLLSLAWNSFTVFSKIFVFLRTSLPKDLNTFNVIAFCPLLAPWLSFSLKVSYTLAISFIFKVKGCYLGCNWNTSGDFSNLSNYAINWTIYKYDQLICSYNDAWHYCWWHSPAWSYLELEHCSKRCSGSWSSVCSYWMTLWTQNGLVNSTNSYSLTPWLNALVGLLLDCVVL